MSIQFYYFEIEPLWVSCLPIRYYYGGNKQLSKVLAFKFTGVYKHCEYTYPPYTALMSMTFLTLDQLMPKLVKYDLLTTRFQCSWSVAKS